jgi:hypothetical protein
MNLHGPWLNHHTTLVKGPDSEKHTMDLVNQPKRQHRRDGKL